MTTIDALYQQKMQAFEEQERALKSRMPETQAELRALEEARAKYLLSAGPIIKEYVSMGASEPSSSSGHAPPKGVMNFVTVEACSHKGKLYRKYMAEIEKKDEFIAKVIQDEASTGRRHDMCDNCEGEYLVENIRGYDSACPRCGLCYPYIGEYQESLTFEQIKSYDITRGNYSYQRRNHFGEWLSKLQAREMTNIPQEVIDALKLELKKARLTNPSDITPKKVKEYLKKLKLSKYYEHVQNITLILTGKSAPKFSPQLEATLRQMFEQIQEPFELYRPKNRTNFLSYAYVIWKFLELLSEDSYREYLPLLKSQQKLYQADCIWKQICAHLKWEFIPSV